MGRLSFSAGEIRSVVVASFPRFGSGNERRFDFEVRVEWDDIEKMIQKFCEAGRPEAIALLDARHLANAVKNAGWHGPTALPQSN
jgi:hypothetical protein